MGCLLSLLVSLACLCPTWTMLWLGLRGEVVVHTVPFGEVRVWMARDERGPVLAVSATQAVTSSAGADCRETRVRFLRIGLGLEADLARFCACAAPGAEAIELSGACPP